MLRNNSRRPQIVSVSESHILFDLMQIGLGTQARPAATAMCDHLLAIAANARRTGPHARLRIRLPALRNSPVLIARIRGDSEISLHIIYEAI